MPAASIAATRSSKSTRRSSTSDIHVRVVAHRGDQARQIDLLARCPARPRRTLKCSSTATLGNGGRAVGRPMAGSS